jgi:hypothetical protein
MAINEKTLTKGQTRKLNALRKSLGNDIADKAFEQWLSSQPAKGTVAQADPVAEKIVAALSDLSNDKSFRLGRRGYVVRRAKGKGASGFVAEKVE